MASGSSSTADNAWSGEDIPYHLWKFQIYHSLRQNSLLGLNVIEMNNISNMAAYAVDESYSPSSLPHYYHLLTSSKR
jgi:hypothetical protein